VLIKLPAVGNYSNGKMRQAKIRKYQTVSAQPLQETIFSYVLSVFFLRNTVMGAASFLPFISEYRAVWLEELFELSNNFDVPIP
jgi:hypothetical protein